MQSAIRPYVTMGVAIAGASVIAVSPVTLPPPDVASIRVATVAALSNVGDEVDDAAADDGLSGLIEFVTAVSAAYGQSASMQAEAFRNVFVEIKALAPVVLANPSLLPRAISTIIRDGTFAQGEAHQLFVGV